MARKDVHAQLVLRPRWPWRRSGCVQRPGRFGEVQVAPCGLLHKAKLVQVHVILQIKMLFIMLQMVYGISCRYGHGAQISAAMSASKA